MEPFSCIFSSLSKLKSFFKSLRFCSQIDIKSALSDVKELKLVNQSFRSAFTGIWTPKAGLDISSSSRLTIILMELGLKRSVS